MKHEHTSEFRLLVAEIAEVERLPLPAALARARDLWIEVGEIDADAPAVPTRRWPRAPTVVLLVLASLLVCSVGVNIVFVLLLTGVVS